ncbi:MAG: peptide-methionine (S)-S-oxide reductase MsrA [Gemmatimonadales bacterium]|nr:peptide-methionine (S)-S-oxide reductase MsrA [Gemmatimonadales bacterium]
MFSRAARMTLALGSAVFIAGCQGARADDAVPLPDPVHASPLAAVAGRDSVLLGGGCFWGVEAVFERVNGVVDAVSGYAGGNVRNPSYERVSAGSTGHAEVVKVVFDPSVVSYADLMKVFFSVVHDPTQLNRQGPDRGTQYRSAVYYASPAQRAMTEKYIDQLTKAKAFSAPIVTEVAPWAQFFQAEAYHQGYYDLHPSQPYIVYNDKPKVEALKQQFPALYRNR